MAINNNSAKEKKLIEKKHYLVEVEALVPTTIKYSVWAENPEEAFSLAQKSPMMEAPRPHLSKMRKLQARIYAFGTHMLKLTKHF